MKSPIRSPELRRLTDRARKLGYTVRFVRFCEDTRTPGMLGRFQGVCDYERREIKVATDGNSRAKLAAILDHELEHAAGAEVGTDHPEHGLTCGNKL